MPDNLEKNKYCFMPHTTKIPLDNKKFSNGVTGLGKRGILSTKNITPYASWEVVICKILNMENRKKI